MNTYFTLFLPGQYIDQRCLYYKKPLIDSGTTGVKASAQVIVPFLTESYRTPPSNVPSVPMCTLRSFPTLIEHTIKWARDKFADLFTNRPLQAQEFLNDSNRFVNKLSEIQSVDEQTEIMGNINRLLRTERPKDFVDCIAWVRRHKKFLRDYFHLDSFRHENYFSDNSIPTSMNCCKDFHPIIELKQMSRFGVAQSVVHMFCNLINQTLCI